MVFIAEQLPQRRVMLSRHVFDIRLGKRPRPHEEYTRGPNYERHADKARDLLRNEAVAAMTVKDLEAKLRGTATKRPDATRAGKAAGYRQGFADGQTTSALVVWAAGVLAPSR